MRNYEISELESAVSRKAARKERLLPRAREETPASRSIVGSGLTPEIKELSAKHISTHVPNVSSGLGKLLFSHNPRQGQLQLMERMLQALDNKTNLLVEMPKGTGCTSASLTAILGWLLEARKQALDKKTRLPRVVCIVRNSQAIPGFLASMSKLPYKLGVSLFGASRDQLCINPALSDSKRVAKDQRCQAQQECGGCSFYTGYRKHVGRIKEVYSPNCRDIEDWRKEGMDEGFCPYYANRATADESPLVVATMQQVMSGERSRLAEIARDGVLYIEDGDLLAAELQASETNSLVLSKTRMQAVEEEIKRCETTTGKAGGLGAISAVARKVAAGVELLAEEVEGHLVEWRQGIVELLGADQESDIVNGVLPELLGQLAQIQETPQVSTKNQISIRRYLLSVEQFVLQLVDVFSSETETWQAKCSKSEFRIEKTRLQLSRLFGGATSIFVSSEYLPRDTRRFADIIGLQLENSQANNETLILPHSLSPLEQQFCFTLVTSVSRQEPRLFKGLCRELFHLPQNQDISPESSRQILDLGTWMGRALQTVPGGVITIFSSELALRHSHDIWKKTGILAQMDTTKKLCLSLQSCTVAENDPIDGMVPELHGHDQTHLTPSMSTSKSDTATRGQAVRKFLDCYKNSGAHLMVSRADLPYIEQSLPGDEATRTVILLGDFSADEGSDTLLPTWNPSYLARIIGKVISHVYDHGMVVAVDADVMTSPIGTAMPTWTSTLLNNRSRLHIEADGMFEKTKRFFDDVARRKNQLRLDGDLKKGVGHPPLNGWALSHVLAENHKKLNAATPTEQSVLSRKFIPLNPERKQLYEKLKSDAQAQLLNNSPVPEEIDPLEKPATKVKLNDCTVISTTATLPSTSEPTEQPTAIEPDNPVNRMISFSALLGPQASQSSQQEDPSLSITYIPNVSSLRTAANTITWNSILTMVASANTNTNGSNDGVHTLSSTANTNNPHLSCVICYEREDKEFLVSKCGHVCCKECWEIRLRELLECPVCKDKVRPKTLVRVETK